MKITETKTTLPQLVRKSAVYKMVIPEGVEGKIRHMQKKFPSTEWSGVLFYTHSGTFEDNSLVITCADIYPMDLGTPTYTEFSMSEDVTAYIAEHIDTLFDCDMALVHSHNNFATFFSGTDLATLRSEGNDTNCFVSLIVNNEGTYSAAVTRKVKVVREIRESGSYRFFGEETPSEYKDSLVKEETEEIQYFMLDIERHLSINPYEDIDSRFKEIESRKQASIGSSLPQACKPTSVMPYADKPSRQAGELSLFNDDTPHSPMPPVQDLDYDKAYLQNTVAKMLLCSLIVNPEKIDMRKWVDNSMERLYDICFEAPDSLKFSSYLDYISDSIINSYTDSRLIRQFDATEQYEDYYYMCVAELIIRELESYNPNPYLKKYIEVFNQYLSY